MSCLSGGSANQAEFGSDDSNSFQWPEESRQTPSLGISQALRLLGLRLFSVCHPEKRTGIACEGDGD